MKYSSTKCVWKLNRTSSIFSQYLGKLKRHFDIDFALRGELDSPFLVASSSLNVYDPGFMKYAFFLNIQAECAGLFLKLLKRASMENCVL